MTVAFWFVYLVLPVGCAFATVITIVARWVDIKHAFHVWRLRRYINRHRDELIETLRCAGITGVHGVMIGEDFFPLKDTPLNHECGCKCDVCEKWIDGLPGEAEANKTFDDMVSNIEFKIQSMPTPTNPGADDIEELEKRMMIPGFLTPVRPRSCHIIDEQAARPQWKCGVCGYYTCGVVCTKCGTPEDHVRTLNEIRNMNELDAIREEAERHVEAWECAGCGETCTHADWCTTCGRDKPEDGSSGMSAPEDKKTLAIDMSSANPGFTAWFKNSHHGTDPFLLYCQGGMSYPDLTIWIDQWRDETGRTA